MAYWLRACRGRRRSRPRPRSAQASRPSGGRPDTPAHPLEEPSVAPYRRPVRYLGRRCCRTGSTTPSPSSAGGAGPRCVSSPSGPTPPRSPAFSLTSARTRAGRPCHTPASHRHGSRASTLQRRPPPRSARVTGPSAGRATGPSPLIGTQAAAARRPSVALRLHPPQVLTWPVPAAGSQGRGSRLCPRCLSVTVGSRTPPRWRRQEGPTPNSPDILGLVDISRELVLSFGRICIQTPAV